MTNPDPLRPVRGILIAALVGGLLWALVFGMILGWGW